MTYSAGVVHTYYMNTYATATRWLGWIIVLAVIAISLPTALAAPSWCDLGPDSCITEIK